VTSQSAISVQEGYDHGGLRVAIMVLVAWHVAAVLPTVISAWLTGGFIASGMIVWLTFTALGCLIISVILHGGGQRLSLALLVSIVLLAGVAAVALFSRGGFFGHYDWALSDTGWFALVAFWRRRLSDLLVFFAASALVATVMLVVLHDTSRANLALLPVECVGVSVLQITIFAGGKAVAATARRGAEAEEDLARTRIARLAAEAVEAARQANYETVRSTVAGLLDGLAKGELDLGNRSACQQVAVAVGRLRRYLVEPDGVPDQLSHELDACADTAERRGIAVDLIAPAGVVPALPVGVRRALTDPVIHVLAATMSRARITVVASAAEVAVAIVADVGLSAQVPAMHDSVTIAQEAEGGLLWVQASWTGPSPLPS
jgi:hypothetical protein